ncbi:tetratricopeptide repeat protein [Alkaliphilus serpentinus]|nr:tetratricopeptide repeat protein [Alkaliphilus serpentinus]
MKLNLFFTSKANRTNFMIDHFNISKATIEGNKQIDPDVSGVQGLKLKGSYKHMPGYWLEIEFCKSLKGVGLYHSLNKEGTSDKGIFYPKSFEKAIDLENGWINKYHISSLDEEEDKWRVFYAEVKSHMKEKRYMVAYWGLKVILKYNPFFLKKYKRFYIFEELAYLFEESNNLGKAIKCLKLHIMLQPDSIEPYLNMSSFFIINGMEEEAVKVCQTALKKKPYNKYLISNLIIALNNMGNYEYSIDYLKKVIHIHPNNAFFWKLLGDIYYEQEMNEESLDCYQRALKKMKVKNIDDFTIDLYNGIAAVYYELEDYQEAVKNYKKSLKLSPDDSYTLLSLSQIYLYKLKDNDSALSYTKKLLDLIPENGYPQYQMGIIYFQLENYEKAKWYLYKARRMMPGYEPVHEAINMLKQFLEEGTNRMKNEE